MNTHCKILSLTVLFLTVATLSSFAATYTGKVVRVLDGDTIEVLVEQKPIRIRLAEIDCPEKNQPYGQAAKKYVLKIAAHEIVTVHSKAKDRYGRTIGEVILPNGDSVNRLLIRDGYAWHYKKYSKDESLAELENQARKNKVGLWQDNNPVPPWSWRRGRKSQEVANKRKKVSSKEVLHTETLTNQALIDLLVAKGIITQEELRAHVQAIRQEQNLEYQHPQ